MTINIIIHCRDGIVLACDSLASQIETVLIPDNAQPVIDPKTGNPLLNPHSQKPIIDANTLVRRDTIINVFGNVNKLFQINDYPIGVVISGLGQIGEDTFDDLFFDFDNSIPSLKDLQSHSYSVNDTVNKLRDFIKVKYNTAFQKLLDNSQDGPRLKLLIGGYSKNQRRGEIYEMQFPENKLIPKNYTKNPYMMVVGGQPDAIQRFISGYSIEMVDYVVNKVCSQWSQQLIEIQKNIKGNILRYLEKSGVKIPKSIKKSIPEINTIEKLIEFPLPRMTYNIPFQHMSLQDAVDFAMFLTTITYGRQRFVSGIPTVGGKVNLATITIKEGFRLLTPKEISVPSINI